MRYVSELTMPIREQTRALLRRALAQLDEDCPGHVAAVHLDHALSLLDAAAPDADVRHEEMLRAARALLD